MVFHRIKNDFKNLTLPSNENEQGVIHWFILKPGDWFLHRYSEVVNPGDGVKIIQRAIFNDTVANKEGDEVVFLVQILQGKVFRV